MSLAALTTAFVVAVVPVAPTEATLVGLGALASVTHASLVAVILVAGLGCSISDHLLYAAGRWGGGRLLGWLMGRGSIGRAAGWLIERFDRWGVAVFIAGRWLPAGGSAGAVLAGTLGWKLRRFTPASLIGSTLWACYATMLGYLGSAFTGNPLAGLGISLVIAVVVGLASRRVMHRRHAVAAPEPVSVASTEPEHTTTPVPQSPATPELVAA
ncbi:DedA family protein [Nocardia alni]|uniref:DedA family protein n=1 Tax=Nocardia alni TaxID=2815723 RepID=UPI001C238652|nr:VTT domain-containing protein [Nocardia alni]